MLTMLVGLLLLSYLSAGSYLPDPTTEKILLVPEVERLAKILGPVIAKHPQFTADFHTEAGRRNVSIKSYANTCGYVFLEMLPSPAEYNFQGDLKPTAEFMIANDLTELPSNWSELSPLAHSFITTRRAAIKQLSANALPETAQFMENVESAFLTFITNRLRDEPIKLKTGGYDYKKRADRTSVLITQLALRYKGLSAEARTDLEIAFCARNTMRWWSHLMNTTRLQSTYDGAVGKFWAIVGLDVDRLLAGSEYFSRQPLNELKAVLEQKAEEINVQAQEYVDMCAETISVLTMNSEERIGMKTAESMGEQWGKEVIDTVEKLLDVLRKENVTFIRVYTKRRNFFYGKLHQRTPKTQAFVKQMHEEFLNVTVAVNNRVATGGTGGKLQTFTNSTKERLRTDTALQRELEQVFCLKTALTAIQEKPVNLADVVIVE